MIYIILGLVVLVGGAFLLMKSGKIEDKNGNNIPDKLEPIIEEVKEVVSKVKTATKAVSPKKTTKKVK